MDCRDLTEQEWIVDKTPKLIDCLDKRLAGGRVDDGGVIASAIRKAETT
jgi:hypothetical protein